ncbi:hypothetical protein PPMP20_07360 [Paraburkholderia phymatum]|uniref:Transmembrane protein n=1 Tax=Paraburkholderia phymatum (strain DSM 17167 / CIP 108236 / LMG 21445 / STM815) TaxID=391038 RepID=B2JIA1_PARP8|nr:hypothetical protein [Paraburkholderia phymatum]ACC70495.1 conserved hypothetical protein [Paraburkholderia phymatum STM815]
MKPLLRAVLIIDALLLLAFGLLLLLTPWKSLYDALQLVQTDPVLVGQGAGIALIGLAWLALHASIDGAMTVTTAKVVGHVNWLTGVLMLVWLLLRHVPQLTGFGQLVAVVTGVVLLVIGLGGVKLSSAVRRRERMAGKAVGERADRVATREAENEARKAERERQVARPGVVYPATGAHVEPTLGGTPTASSRPVSPATGHPVEPGLTAAASRPMMPEAAAAAREDALAHKRRADAHEDAAARERAAAERSAADARSAEAKPGSPSGTPRPPFHG